MSVLSTQTTSIGLLSGVENDSYNSRDKGGYLDEVIDSYEQLENLADDFEHGQGIFGDYEGFSETESRRGIVRCLVSDSVLDSFSSDYFPAAVNSGYSLEGALSVGENNFAWLGTVERRRDEAPESLYSHNSGEIRHAVEGGGEIGRLPEGYTQEFLGEEASEQDRETTESLWSEVFDDCYVAPINRNLVDSVYDGPPLASVIRDQEGDIVSTAAAEPVRISTEAADLEIVELSEFATDPDQTGEGLASYNGQTLLETVQDYGVDAVYSQNTSAEPGMTAVASNLGGELNGVLRSHANVGNPSQDLILTGFESDPS